MDTIARLRLRRAAITGVFIVGVFATAATSPPSTSIQIPAQSASVHLDAEHPAALTRIVVRVNEEATSAHFYNGAHVRLSAVQSVGSSGSAFGAADGARFIIASIPPGAATAAPEWARPDAEPGPTPYQVEVRPGLEVALPMDCGIGPCERSFWLIAELTDPEAGSIEIELQVSGALQYTNTTWPSGAGATIDIDPPILVAGPAPQLVVSTAPEVIELGPRQPAAARVVEVSIGADAIGKDGESIAVMSVDLSSRPGSGGDYERQPIVNVYPLDGIGADNPEGPLPTGLERKPDPFSGCVVSAKCTRRFLVTLEWTGDAGEDEAYDWSVTVRRLDLVRAWSAPAELSATVERRFELAADAPSAVFHLEGQSVGIGSDDAPQLRLELGAMTTATDPLARLLPAPAVMTYRTRVLGVDPLQSPDVYQAAANLDLPGSRAGMKGIYRRFGAGLASVTTNLFAGCQVGDACPELTITTIALRDRPEAPLPNVPFEWSLDLTLYSFTEAPLTLSSIDHSPTAP
jgi:hypothetical protein